MCRTLKFFTCLTFCLIHTNTYCGDTTMLSNHETGILDKLLQIEQKKKKTPKKPKKQIEQFHSAKFVWFVS